MALGGTWQPIETAPRDRTILLANFDVETIAIAHFDDGQWSLGHHDGGWFWLLDFEPRWWLPANYKGNPFKATIPAAAA